MPYPSVPEALAAVAGRSGRSSQVSPWMRHMADVGRSHPSHHHRGDGVLEDELLLTVRLQYHGVLVEGADAARQLYATQQVNRDAESLLAGRVKEGILDVLRRLIAIHSRSPRFLNCEPSTHCPTCVGSFNSKQTTCSAGLPAVPEHGGLIPASSAPLLRDRTSGRQCEYDTAIPAAFQPGSCAV
jgi:hypothetical protein